MSYLNKALLALIALIMVSRSSGSDSIAILPGNMPADGLENEKGLATPPTSCSSVLSLDTLPRQTYTILIESSVGTPLDPLELCHGSAPPLWFSVRDQNGDVANLGPGVSIAWEYSDDNGANWLSFAGLGMNSYNFLVTANNPVTAISNCGPAHLTGFIDRIYRVILITSNDTFYVESASLRICCPATGASIFLQKTKDGNTYSPNTNLCESEAYLLKATLNNLPLPPPDPNNNVEINWSVTVDGNQVPGSGFSLLSHDMIQYPTGITPLTLSAMNTICFTATVENCVCQPITYTQCFQIRKEPLCASIEPMTMPDNLIPTGTAGVYYICPGQDAALTKIPGTVFAHCAQRQWQFGYSTAPGVAPSHWHNYVSSVYSDMLNTNNLPALNPPYSPPIAWPPGSPCISYRINCTAVTTDCPDCQTNEIQICLFPPLIKPTIDVTPMPACAGDLITLGISNVNSYSPVPLFDWYHNGLWLGQGDNFAVTQPGNYQVTVRDICYEEDSDLLILDICEAKALITCPLPPCPGVGYPIILDGSSSFTTCPPGGLVYQWSWDSGTPVSTSFDQPTLEHIPASTGTTYTLTVTNAQGCSHTTNATVVPCD